MFRKMLTQYVRRRTDPVARVSNVQAAVREAETLLDRVRDDGPAKHQFDDQLAHRAEDILAVLLLAASRSGSSTAKVEEWIAKLVSGPEAVSSVLRQVDGYLGDDASLLRSELWRTFGPGVDGGGETAAIRGFLVLAMQARWDCLFPLGHYE